MTFEVLSEIVERDVEQANKVLGDRQFRIERCTEGVRPRLFVSERGAEKGIGVQFEMSETAIRINGGGVQFYIRPGWMERNVGCTSMMNSTPTSSGRSAS